MGETKLGDIIDVTHGFAFKGEHFRDEPTGDLLLTPGNFRVGGGFQMGKEKYYSGPVPEDYVLPPGELVVTMTDLSKESDTLGYPALLPNVPGLRFLHNQRVGRVLIKDEAQVDRRFLFYAMCTDDYRNEVLASATGTGVKHTAPTRIEAFRFDLPPLPEQRAIARVLGGLDDKIELNRRMNRTLEDLARGLFRSWFVDFDPVTMNGNAKTPNAPPGLFPTRLIDSPLGPIPEGWKVGTVGAEFSLTMGQSPPGSTYNEDGAGVPFYQGRTDFGFRFPTRRVYCTAPTRFAEPGDTLVSVRAPVGDINVADERCAAGRGVAAVRHRSGATSYTYAMMAAQREAFDVFNGDGTLFGCIGKVDFERMQVLVPPPAVVAAFERIAAPWDRQIEVNEKQARSLAATRDALLPVLLSGEVRLRSEREAERAVEDSLQATSPPPRAGGNTSPRGGKAAGTMKGRA